MVQRGSQAVDHAFDLQARFGEIKQQAELPAGRFQMIGALHPNRDLSPGGRRGGSKPRAERDPSAVQLL